MGSSGLRGIPRLILYLEGLAQFPDVSEKLGGLQQSVPARLHGNVPSSRKDHCELGPPPARPAHSPVCLLGNTPSPA